MEAKLLEYFIESSTSNIYMDSVVIGIHGYNDDKRYISFSHAYNDGVEVSSFLNREYHLSYNTIKKAILDHNGDYSTQHNTDVCHDLDPSKELTLSLFKELAKKLGYPYCKEIGHFEHDWNIWLLWMGYDLSLENEQTEDINWEFEEMRIKNYLVRYVHAYFGPQSFLNKDGHKKLKSLHLFGNPEEHLHICINGDPLKDYPGYNKLTNIASCKITGYIYEKELEDSDVYKKTRKSFDDFLEKILADLKNEESIKTYCTSNGFETYYDDQAPYD